MAVLKFETNKPLQIALAYDEGKICQGRFGDQIMYSLAEPRDHVVYFAPAVDVKIHELGITRGELFNVCKREVTRGKRRSIQWDVWRPQADEIAGDGGDGTGIDDSELMRDVRQSIHIASTGNNGRGTWPERKAAAAALETAAVPPNAQGAPTGRLLAPRMDDRTNNGNGSTAAGRPPLKIPMDRALVDCVKMVQHAMKETGEQWSDSARQDMVSTLIIQLEKNGWLACYSGGAQ